MGKTKAINLVSSLNNYKPIKGQPKFEIPKSE